MSLLLDSFDSAQGLAVGLRLGPLERRYDYRYHYLNQFVKFLMPQLPLAIFTRPPSTTPKAGQSGFGLRRFERCYDYHYNYLD